MAEAKSLEPKDERTKYGELLSQAITDKSFFHYSPSDFSRPDKGDLGDILKQRHRQRKWLFWYALGFSSFTVVGLAAMLYAQAVYKSKYGSNLFGELELGTVGIGVFIQFLGLLKIITDSLWNDKPYLDSGALNSRQKE